MKKINSALLFVLISSFAFGQFDGGVGTPGCQAVSCEDPAILGWATGCEVTRGYQDIAAPSVLVSYGSEQDAVGAVTRSTMDVVSLGDGGTAILTFAIPISDGDGYDFAVFENSLNDNFLELGFVEVSSDGENWVRFPATSNTPTDQQIGSFGSIDPSKIHNLAGKHRGGWGTPFDLNELADSSGIDIQAVRYVKITDVIGSIDPQFATYDAHGNIVNDPYPTDFNSGGFDLAGVAILNGWKPNKTNEKEMPRITVYPNPFVKSVTVEYRCPVLCTLYNSLGQVMGEWSLEEGTNSLDMQQYPSGVYIISIDKHYQKLIKK